jgi:hypothetical protein
MGAMVEGMCYFHWKGPRVAQVDHSSKVYFGPRFLQHVCTRVLTCNTFSTLYYVGTARLSVCLLLLNTISHSPSSFLLNEISKWPSATPAEKCGYLWKWKSINRGLDAWGRNNRPRYIHVCSCYFLFRVRLMACSALQLIQQSNDVEKDTIPI